MPPGLDISESKRIFFEKKKQKTFIRWSPDKQPVHEGAG
jgi:hypothetical protein